MSTSIRCLVAPTAASVVVPASFEFDGKTIAEYFSQGSGGDIVLDVRHSSDVVLGRAVVDDAELQVALGDLTGNVSVPGLVHRIGLLVAGEYRHHSKALGYMFDLGFTVDDSGTVPREGCAIFVDAIRALRGAGSAFDTELTFTAIHELGHVFNLWHDDSVKNFMARSKFETVFTAPIEFQPAHGGFLARCSQAKEVHPGGSAFGRRGTLASGDADPHNEPASGDFGLELRVEMNQREFFAFEPVEIEVELRVAAGVQRSFAAPDAIDPAYNLFEIWIEQPDEERRRYRSIKHFCTPTGTLMISPERPFRRDIAIFAGARGYTFRHAGLHRIWARFVVAGVGVLTSNVLEVNVLADLGDDRHTAWARVLRQARVAHLLFYRSFPLRGRNSQALAALKELFPERAAAATAQYAQGRALLRDAERAATKKATQANRAKGLACLARAANHPRLGNHQRAVAERLMATISASS